MYVCMYVSVGPLHAAIHFSRELGYDHDDVRQLQDSAEGLFFLRRAALLGISLAPSLLKWVASSHELVCAYVCMCVCAL